MILMSVFPTPPNILNITTDHFRRRYVALEYQNKKQKLFPQSGRKPADSPSSILAGNYLDFFRCILASFERFSPGTNLESLGKIQKISGRNSASMFRRLPVYYCGAVSCFLTWVSVRDLPLQDKFIYIAKSYISH